MTNGLFILISGPALSGKSTAIESISKNFFNSLVVSTDNIRQQKFGDYLFIKEREYLVWEEAYQLIKSGLSKNKIVFLDATARTKDYRDTILENVQAKNILYLYFEPFSFEELLERNKKRVWKQIPEDALYKMWYEYNLPSQTELDRYLKTFLIRKGQEDFTEIVKFIENFLN